MEATKDHKSGFVAVIGKPNAGKSTLVNRMVGHPVSIITDKAQTTRHRILGIANQPGYQIVLSDTPGLIIPKYGLHKEMMRQINFSLEDADLVLVVVDINEKYPENELLEKVKGLKLPKILCINKIDKASDDKFDMRKEALTKEVEFDEVMAISALYGGGTDELLNTILKHLPEAPPYFEKDAITDRPERFFVSEIIREKIFVLTHEEIPYSTTVTVTEFNEHEDHVHIYADIHVSRKSQKGMLIGKGASLIKKIRVQAQRDIRRFLDVPVKLELYVRVTEGWRDNDSQLRNMGYK